MRKLILSFCFAVILSTAFAQQKNYVPKNYPKVYSPSEESLNTVNKQPEWFKDAKLGVYFHWGLYSVPAFKGEWYAKWMHTTTDQSWGSGSMAYHTKTYGDPSEFGYHHFKPLFKAEDYNPKEWLKMFKDAGAKFTGPVVQHHDGFAMWKSDVNPNNAFDEGPKRDLAGEFLLEAQEQGFKTIATFHHSLTMPAFNNRTKKVEGYYPYNEKLFTSTKDPKLKWMYGNVTKEEYLPYWENIVYEVVDKYSPDMIWFDSGSYRIPTQNFLSVLTHHFNAAAARGEEGVVFTKEKHRMLDIRLLDQEQGGLREMPEDYWMTDVTLSDKGWCYIQNQTYKDLDMIIRNMIDVWSKQGIVLLNVSPTASGIINKEQKSLLKGLGKWMKTFGEAVYNTRAHTINGYGNAVHKDGKHAEQSATMKYTENDMRFTKSKDGKYLYVFLLGQTEEGEELTIKHVLDGVLNKKVSQVSQIGSSKKVTWKHTEELKITAPEQTVKNEIATVFKITLK